MPSSSARACRMHYPSQRFSFYRPTSVWQAVQKVELLTTQSPSSFSYFLRLRSKFLFYVLFLNTLIMSYRLNVTDQVSHLGKTTWKTIILRIVNLNVFRRHTETRNLARRILVNIRWIIKYKVVQIWPGPTAACLHTISPGHIWTTL